MCTYFCVQYFTESDTKAENSNNNNNNIYLTAIGLSPGGSSYYMYINMKKRVTRKFKSGGLHERHVVATWKMGNHY